MLNWVKTFLCVVALVFTACRKGQTFAGPSQGVQLQIAGHPVYSWPADFMPQQAHKQERGSQLVALSFVDSGAGRHGTQLGVAVQQPLGSRYGDVRDPSGLLSLPRLGPVKRCNLRERLVSFANVLHEAESEDSLPAGLLSFDETVLTSSDSCAVLPFLDCAHAVFAVRGLERWGGWANTDSAGEGDGFAVHPLVQVRHRLDACARRTHFVGAPGAVGYFDIQGHSVLFFPKQVFAILIFDQVFENLAVALSAQAPVASFAAPAKGGASCPAKNDAKLREIGASTSPSDLPLSCLESPVSLDACVGCENLRQGGIFAAYLIERPGILNENIFPVILEMK